MKKLISAAAVIAAMGCLTFPAYADATVSVTIADANGDLAVANEFVEVTDIDNDGAITINDALYAAHEKFYDGGAAAGYGSAEGDYGLMLTKLWGAENGGSYGYYLNDASAFSLTDPVKDNDWINAFVYTDSTGWSDTFCYFNYLDTFSDTGDVKLTLSKAAFDADWNPVTLPVAGAEITVNGEKVGAVTDDNGSVSLKFTDDGNYLISAVSDSETLVPPVCKATVKLQSDAQTVAAGDVSVQADSSKGSPDTGIADTAAVAGLAIIAAGGVVLAKKRK